LEKRIFSNERYAGELSATNFGAAGLWCVNKLECYGFRTGMKPHVARFIISILTTGFAFGFAAGYEHFVLSSSLGRAEPFDLLIEEVRATRPL